MNLKRVLCILGILALMILLTGCVEQMETAVKPDTDLTAARTVDKVPVPEIGDLPLVDDPALYKDQDPKSLQYFYITIMGGTASDGTNHTLSEVNAYLNLQGMVDVKKIKTGIVFQIGDEFGPLPGELGFGAITTNATMNVRGRTSTIAPQKSYRIDLFSNAGLWKGQRAFALNKHPFDRTRLRNMLFFTLLQRVPNMTSLRTQFAQVFIRDETAGETAFTDYGLYTLVELPNGRYLRNHGLSRDGNLYKANMCEFYRYEDQIRLATDPLYDLEAFSQVLEPKTTEDHAKLIEMLDAVNNFTTPIEDTVEAYFNLENVTSFLAYNILMGNIDTNSQNYLLYSPVNSRTWYFLCWDGDGCLNAYEQKLFRTEDDGGVWQAGVSNYWGVQLFNRMLRVDAYRKALLDKMEMLRGIITSEVIAAEIAKYRTVTDTFTRRMPDIINLDATIAQQDLLYEHMPYDVDIAYQKFLDSLKRPMPFFLGNLEREEDALFLYWGEAYSFDAELVSYTVQIATDWSFAPETVVFEAGPQLQINVTVPMLPAGDYCWRVTAQNESGYTQSAFDWFITGETRHQGMRRFTVSDTGEVLNLE